MTTSKDADKIRPVLRHIHDIQVCDFVRFEIEFPDGSKRTEHNTDWNAIGTLRTVKHEDRDKTIMICNVPIKKLKVKCLELSKELTSKKDEDLYQMTRASIMESREKPGEYVTTVVGKTIGRLKGDKIIEEYFLDARTNKIIKTI